jgi:putative ABC transport system permease protein
VIEVEEMEGEHRRRPLPIEGLVDSTLGLAGHIRAAELARFLGQDELYSSAAIAIDPLYADGVYRALKGIPQVVGVTRKASAIEQFQSQSGGSIITMTIILTLFAATIAIGVVYNNARIALSQRARELASLRVLGFTRAEVSTVLLSEMGVQVILAMPPGLWLGYRMAVALASMADPETYRFPVVISGHTYVFAVLVVVASALVSGLIVRRRVDRLDLVSVLKSRE